ncbi:unnamed protein product [Acanthoscelides obtectus]|uniref:Uncharacterized protein n=1 Tax=Acanthoscelides obtectus TaxID=200917 RepID=A0A9P0QAD5_ACAOB|nr:unnamed protein product [Acanthoscelides obtectus]CAK1682487.1 hypothetical protein AOBTE_LOCUS33667 [Acanthoscelides obtectus]
MENLTFRERYVVEHAGYDGQQIRHHVFKPPFALDLLPPDLQTQATWLMQHHHCINWNSGFTPLHTFPKIMDELTKHADRIFFKGIEQANCLRRFSRKPVIEFAEQPRLEPASSACFYHSKPITMCTLSNVFYLYKNFIMS